MLRKASASSFPQAVPGRVERQGCAAIGFQPPATLICKNEKAEEIAVGLLMKVAAVLILRPEQRDDLVDNFVVCPLLRVPMCFPDRLNWEAIFKKCPGLSARSERLELPTPDF